MALQPLKGKKVRPNDGRKLLGTILEVWPMERPKLDFVCLRWDDDKPGKRRWFPLRDLE